MNSTLLRKELRALRFCTLLIVVLISILWIFILLTDFPDRQPDAADSSASDWWINWLIVGLFIGMTSINQEREHQTLGFLDGLAVGRRSIFLHKLLAAVLVGAFFCLLSFMSELLLGVLSATSVSGRLMWERDLAEAGLGLLLGVTVIGAGMLLSFTRKWFPLMAGLLILAMVLLSTSSHPLMSWLDSNALVSPEIGDRGELIIPWKQVGGFSILAGAILLLAGLLFGWRDGRVSRFFEREFTILMKILVTFGVLGVWGTALVFLGNSLKESDEANPVGDSAGVIKATDTAAGVVGFASHETEHYDVLFKESQRKVVMERVGGMDDIYQQAAAYFQNPKVPGGRIVLDVASSVDSHAAGVANWTKIRVPLTREGGSEQFEQTIRHETAHVFIEQLSDGKASDHFNAMRAFHEGVATAVELSPDDEATRKARLKMERWVALADSRGRVPLETLLDDDLLQKQYDPALAYPLGYVFAKALVEIGGPDLPRRVVETLRDSPPPPNPTSRQLWQHVLQECGTSLETVVAVYMAGLTRISNQENSYVAGFPRLSAEVTVEGEEIIIRLNPFTGSIAGAAPICYVEKSMGLADDKQPVRASPDGSFRLKRSDLRGNRLRYLLGWRAEDMRYPVFEPWAEKVIQ